ncbi:hypothetical protein ACF1G5_36165 [Streptomyces coeruleorubidus]|uniref:hypothetical protein n=1 Tax=Streptomyces coeruleorubidus TaxID=116188 RepID=UPI0036FC2CF5
MHRTARTVASTGSARPRVAALTTVLLVLLAALGIAGPQPGATGGAAGWPVAGVVAGAARHGDTGPRAGDGCDVVCVNGPRAGDGCDVVCVNGPRADDGCETVCAVRAAISQEARSEHPAPRGHLTTCVPGTDVTPPGAARLLPAPAAHTPSSCPHAPHDRGRAPPATSGI